MKNVVILGAAGRTGALLVDAALKAGYKVTAFVRTGEQVAPKDNLVVIEGDARRVEDLQFAFGGQAAIISTLGSSKLHDDLMTEATKALVTAAKANNVPRVIMMSSFLASPQLKRTLISRVLGKLMSAMVNDKQSGEAVLKESGLDWTIVYSTRLSDGPLTKETHIVPEGDFVDTNNNTSRANVAAFLVSEIENSAHSKQVILITEK